MCAIADAMAEHDADLLRYLESILDSTDEAMDVFDEVFSRFHEAMTGGTVIENPRAWLFKVARNEAIDVLRKRKPLVPLQDTATECRHLNTVESRVDLSRAMEHLPGPLRDVFVLRAEGMRHSEIAARLGISLTASTTRHSTAMRLVRDRLSAEPRQSRCIEQYTRQSSVDYHPTVTTIHESTRWGDPVGR